jgi:hypothetical protein
MMRGFQNHSMLTAVGTFFFVVHLVGGGGASRL